MIPKVQDTSQLSMFFSFESSLDHKHPLYVLSKEIDWSLFEKAFLTLYSKNKGRPGKPIRMMVGLLILKHLRNISDESVVAQWSENVYYQYFCGKTEFTPSVPCEASELVHFRDRIGSAGIELIFKESIRVNGKDALDENVSIDTTVQEKNITFPTDAKLHKKIIKKCQAIAEREDLPVRQSYTRTLKKLSVDQRFRNHPKNYKKAKKADKKIKTIAGRLVREVERNLPPESIYQIDIELFKRVLAQTKNSEHKIYSLHEPEVCCIAKGKEHKKYEFGNKTGVAKTHTGVIVGAMSFRNEYDGHTTKPLLKQVKRLVGKLPKIASGDRGFRGITQVETTLVQIPKPYDTNKVSYYQLTKARKAFRKRAGIEPIIGHLKTDHRLSRNFYKGVVGDERNIMLAAAAFNFKRRMRMILHSLFVFFKTLFLDFVFCFRHYPNRILLQ